MSHTNIANSISSSLIDWLNTNITDAVFRSVIAFPRDSVRDRAKQRRAGLLRLERDEPFYSQERLYKFTLRLYLGRYNNDPAAYYDFVEEVKDVLNSRMYDHNIYQGFAVNNVNYSEESRVPDFADIGMEVLWVRQTPLKLFNVDLIQTFYTESIDDATLTGSNVGASNLELLKDRDPSTIGLSVTTPIASIEIDFAESYRHINYVILGGLTSDVDLKVTVSHYDAGLGDWVELDWLLANGKALQGVEFDQVAASKIKIQFDSFPPGIGPPATFEMSYVFVGKKYEFPKTYDVRGSQNGVDALVVNVDRDEIAGFKNRFQIDGIEKRFWDVTWGLRKNHVDELISTLLLACVNEKNVIFRDGYVNEDIYHLVKLQDDYVRINQIAEDYIRLKLQMAEV